MSQRLFSDPRQGRRPWPWLMLAWITLALSLRAEPLTCAVCLQRIQTEFVWWQSATRPKPLPMCVPCSKVEKRCFVCQIPLKAQLRTIEDGRLFCPTHATEGVFDNPTAQRTYEELKHDLFPILSGLGRLPNQHVRVQLIDNREMARLRGRSISQAESRPTLGLTHSRRDPNGRWDHLIYALSGLPQARLAAVLAHEYGHVWLHENLPEHRDVQSHTIEGFCELVAFHVMKHRQETREQEVIRANLYTHGQFKTLLEASDQYALHRVVTWIKNGRTASLSPTNTAVELSMTRPRPTAGPPLSATPVPTPVPDRLELKGVSGKPGQRYAMINDQTVQAGEAANVRVGTTKVRIRCLEVEDRSARLEVQGHPQPVKLHLGGPGFAP